MLLFLFFFITTSDAFSVNYSISTCPLIHTVISDFAYDQYGGLNSIPVYAQSFLSCTGKNMSYVFAAASSEQKKWIIYYGLSENTQLILDENLTLYGNAIGSGLTFYSEIVTTLPKRAFFQSNRMAQFALPTIYIYRQELDSLSNAGPIIGTIFFGSIFIASVFIIQCFKS